MNEAKLIGESGEAAYCKGTDENGECKVYSAYQRNEIVSLWENPDGSTFVTVRHKNQSESRAQRKKEAETLRKGLESGEAIRDRIGKVKWKKH